MNTYDFDQTVFNPDSSYKFYLFCLKRYTARVLKTVPRSLGKAIAYKRGKIGAKELREQLFSFLAQVDDAQAAVEAFWDINFCKIEKWYLAQKREDDIIISASPEFLLAPVCRRLGVRLIATPMDIKSGKINGLNCHDSEKVRRFYESFPEAHTENFYSDSLSDSPMARIADNAWLVRFDDIRPWPQEHLN